SHPRDLRTELLKAALAFIKRDGLHALSLREVARAAGVSHNAPYRYFANKEALLAALAASGFAQLRADLMAAGAIETDDRLVALGSAYVSFARANAGLFRLMFNGGIDRQAFPELAQAASEAFAVLLNATGENGSVCRDAALGAWSMVHGLSNLVVERQLGEDLEADIEASLILRRVANAYDRMRANRKQ
ncbi:TetR/AcrR family transcriptional regulator, partial [Pantanalinema rosaneae CENA516]|uniref:TetR/AcrR family transcriptional regulator n=1 Tax=Pantanalinema rosaneae TaxID=1620701 RepID=UPI003D6FE051